MTNKVGDTIASAVTNLDLHDIARAGKTYGIKKYYVVTPLADQNELVQQIVDHWTRGGGAAYNALRKEAMDLICIRQTLDAVKDDIGQAETGPLITVATCARDGENRAAFADIRDLVHSGNPCLLVLGTAWGLADSVLVAADHLLAPIAGNTGYNHLSVRSAAAIILDRLLGE